jgi:hypothetical protein
MAKKQSNRKTNPLTQRIRKSDAVWLEGPVPAGFWQYAEHRRAYLIWLGQKLGFRRLEDFYKIKTEHFKQNRGSGALLHCWQSSAVFAVTDTFPDHDWKEWLFVSCPRSFWKDAKNHHRYMAWLAEQCDIKQPDDWYKITNQDFRSHKGGAFLLHYQSTISTAVSKFLPEHKFNEWMFAKTPKRFWEDRKNRIRYMKWLGTRLGITNREQWYDVARSQFEENQGNQLIKYYDGSPLAAVMDCMSNRSWDEWRFARVPAGFWKKKANRERYVGWFEKRLKIRKPEDWHRIRRIDLKENFGGGLLAMYPSIDAMLKASGRTLPKADKNAASKKKTTSKNTASKKTASKKSVEKQVGS